MNLLTISPENFDFHEIRDTEVQSGLISESEHLFMDIFAEVLLSSKSESDPRSITHHVPIKVSPAKAYFFVTLSSRNIAYK